MKKSRFTEQQIAVILKQVDDGLGDDDVCRKVGVSQQTYYHWRKKYGGLMPLEVKCLKQLEEENRRLNEMVADLSLHETMLQDVPLNRLRGLRGHAALSTFFKARSEPRSDKPAVASACRSLATSKSRAAHRRPPLNSGSKRYPRREFVTDTCVSMWSCSAKAGT